jgi:hypothetical protein
MILVYSKKFIQLKTTAVTTTKCTLFCRYSFLSPVPPVIVKWVELLLCIGGVLDSSLSLELCYPD